MGFDVDTSAFDRMTKQLEQRAIENTQAYGRQIGDTFESTAKSGAPWTDHKGVARAGLMCKVSGREKVQVVMGGSAPNYKRGPNSVADYMEYLEFDHDGRFGIITPTFSSMIASVREQFPEAVISGARYSLRRDRMRARMRAAKSKRKRRGR